MEKTKAFYTGQRLKEIFWSSGERCRVGEHRDKTEITIAYIEVVMENGQMAGVPWAIVQWSDGKTLKYNLAEMDGVELASDCSS